MVAVSQGFAQTAYLWGRVCFEGWTGRLAVVVPFGVEGEVGLFLVDKVDEIESDEVLV